MVTIAAFLFICVVGLWFLTWPFRGVGRDVAKIAEANADYKRFKRLTQVPEDERTEEQRAALEQIQARREAALVKGLILLVAVVGVIIWMLVVQQQQQGR